MESKYNERKPISRELPEMFRPPINRAMRTLDRSFFRRSVPLSAARIFKASDISKIRKELTKSNDVLSVPRLNAIRQVEGQDGSSLKALLLREDLKADGGLFRVELKAGYEELILMRLHRQVNLVADY
jgi:tRNA (guanine37-N1)-methyltransferase